MNFDKISISRGKILTKAIVFTHCCMLSCCMSIKDQGRYKSHKLKKKIAKSGNHNSYHTSSKRKINHES